MQGSQRLVLAGMKQFSAGLSRASVGRYETIRCRPVQARPVLAGMKQFSAGLVGFRGLFIFSPSPELKKG